MNMRLTEKRNELELTVSELANLLGVSAIELAAWERDEASCPFQRMLELALEAIEADTAVDRLIEKVKGLGSEGERSVFLALAEDEIARIEERHAKREKEKERSKAWWTEHNRWCEEHGMPVRDAAKSLEQA